MQLKRWGAYQDHGKTDLLPEGATFSVGFSGDGMEASFKGREGEIRNDGTRNSTYRYSLHLTTRELRELFMRPLRVPDSERELWWTFFELWEKRVKDQVGD